MHLSFMSMHLPSCRNDLHQLLILVELFQYLLQEFISKCTVFMCINTLSSARSFGKKMVGLMPLMWEICTKLMAVLPELASTTYLVDLNTFLLYPSSTIFFTARSLLLPNGFINSHLIFNYNIKYINFTSDCLRECWQIH